MARALVHTHHGFPRRTRGQTEDLAGNGVEPCALVVYALVGLDCEVATVRLGQLLGGDAEEPVVNIHERGHD